MVALLLECHGRIRAFTTLAVQIAEGQAAAPELADAAARLHRYFTLALPLHEADEEQTLRPRLDETAPPALRAALATMVGEHAAAHPLLVELTSAWDVARVDPRHPLLAATHERAQRFAAQMELHLAAEERLVFPAVQQLNPAAQAAILVEMSARRETR